MQRILLTGASGFVGRHVDVALRAAGRPVLRGTRDPARAAREGWVRLDLDAPETIRAAMEGCEAAIYLVHSIDDSSDYPDREARAAEAFADAAAAAGLRRIVYVGGVAPEGACSRHLSSRLRVGEILRAGPVPCVELRAALVIGAGGSSWLMVRDLAARLPAMLLPRWLQNASWPVGVEDVAVAVVRALSLPTATSVWYDLPGPERLTHAELLLRVASAMGKRPRLVGVPVLTPTLSSYWIALVTRAGLPLARELVQGLLSDLDPAGPSFWEVAGVGLPRPLDPVIRSALADEQAEVLPSERSRARIDARTKALACAA